MFARRIRTLQLKVQNEVSTRESPGNYRLARIERYERYANPPLKKPSRLVPILVGVMSALYVFVGLYPKLVDQSALTFDDAVFTDLSDRLVKAVFDKESYTWRRSKEGTVVPESVCEKKG